MIFLNYTWQDAVAIGIAAVCAVFALRMFWRSMTGARNCCGKCPSSNAKQLVSITPPKDSPSSRR